MINKEIIIIIIIIIININSMPVSRPTGSL